MSRGLGDVYKRQAPQLIAIVAGMAFYMDFAGMSAGAPRPRRLLWLAGMSAILSAASLVSTLAELSLIYDHISFEEEYADQIKDYNGEFADYAGDAAVVNFYEYPGAPEVKHGFETGDVDVLDCLTGASDNPSYISKIFVDENGRTWGYVTYMYGCRNSWFCLDAPDGAGLPVRAVAEPEIVPARTPTLPAKGYTAYILSLIHI